MGFLDVFAKRAKGGGPFSRRDYRDRGAYRPNYSRLASALVDVLEFEDHLDVGCGQGLLLEPLLAEHGKDCYGVEGSPAALEFALPHVRGRLRIATLQELTIDRAYDLVSCVEVLEHVPEAESDRVVGMLARAARRFIYFSAAIPGQSGVGHINCQPTLFWLLAFDRHGWQLDLARSGALRERIVGMEPCWWLPQNALILSPKPAG